MIKTFTAVVAAALALTAALGAAQASATVLCKENTTTCAPESIYPSGTTISSTLKAGSKFKITASGLTLECTSSEVSGKTKVEKGAPLSAEISGLTVGGCTGCKSGTAQNLPYSSGIERISGGPKASVTMESGGKGAPGISWSNCTIFNVPCTYSLPNATLEGGNPATLKPEGAVIRQEGSSGLCPKEGSLNPTTYEVTSPKPVYASAGANIGHTVLCKEQATVCPSQAATYPTGTTVKTSKGTIVFRGLILNLNCSSAMSLGTTKEHGNPLPVEVSSLTYSKCEGGACESASTPTPLTGSVAATSGGNGTLDTAYIIKLKNCLIAGGGECEYAIYNAHFSVTGGTSSEVARLLMPYTNIVRYGGSPQCPSEAEATAEYHLESPLPFWIEKAEI